MLPCDLKSFQANETNGTFRKVCCVSPDTIDADFMDLDTCHATRVNSYLSQPIYSLHDPVREILCLLRLKNLFKDQTHELFPVVSAYELLTESRQYAITMDLVACGSLAAFYNIGEWNDELLMQDSVQGSKVQKLSVLIRILYALYALNYVADIAHNDLSSHNILMDRTEHLFVKLLFENPHGVTQSVVVPTYGVKPILCDFGTATQFSTTVKPMDDFDEVKYYLNGTIPPCNREVRSDAAEDVTFLLHVYQRLMEEDPLCTEGAMENNTYTIHAESALSRKYGWNRTASIVVYTLCGVLLLGVPMIIYLSWG